MEISSAEAAERLEVSPRRLRQLIERGQLNARRVGGNWVVDEAQLGRRRLVSRPLSDRMAWGLVALLSGQALEVGPAERLRLRKLADRLRSAGDPGDLLRAWLRLRAQRVEVACSAGDLPDLAADSRIVLSGISDSRSGISAGQEVEGYVHVDDWPPVERDFLLVASSRPNVYLHLVDRHIASPPPAILIAADLSDHHGAREDSQISSVLAGIR